MPWSQEFFFLILKYEHIMDLVRNYIRQQIAAIPAERHTIVVSHTFEQDCVLGMSSQPM